MSIDLSKLCADFLRQNHTSRSTEKLKASHARELVAAFFGYKSHAALMAEKGYPLDRLEEAYIFIPDIPLMNDRRAKLGGLPDDLIPSIDIAKLLSGMLSDEGLCGGNIWLYDSLETYIAEVLLPDCQTLIDDQLSGTMAETNAGFFDSPYYDDVQIEDRGDELVAIAKTQYKGEPLDDKPFCGDTIDMVVQVTLPRMAGKRGFYDFELEVGGSVNDDWVDPELRYGKRPRSNLAAELGITDDDLELLEWETLENSSDDGLPYDYVLTFDESCPLEILEKINGLDDDRTIRVSVNAFDNPYPDEPDEHMHYEVPNIRPKDQWLEMTGGFRFGETPEQFQHRQAEIHALRNRIAQGQATPNDVGRLSHLLGTDQDDEFGDIF
ncbi:hypothetical protein EUZ85_30015 [Hahella sp. KA22]|uniref:hypothetical protein n=1 Tax=Hahella sp. KA22 TaxID=1628392 RepID=UPI000FDD8725|nr:hypothetical protein [Hahella sp. KA22]AZZ94720.1 hypothetical protein ENC22_27430 [Hahella sp. KA22]QAY58094.1 hypothetical protein EUZ85_30015 [Hahella sp. KA22]